MPLEPEFNKFNDEAGFRTQFLVPLIRRLGFSLVCEYHGQQEFGKDLVFGEIDRFGEVTYHGLQAKYQDSISQGDSAGLVDDCNEAFGNPFRHPNTGANYRISTFIVANAGSISDNARTNFYNRLAVPHGGHIKMLDGKAVLALDRWATINRVENVGEVLSGLRIELAANANQMRLIRRGLQIFIEEKTKGTSTGATVPANRLRLIAIEHYLQKPFLPSQVRVGDANNYWFLADTGVNGMLVTLASIFAAEAKMTFIANRILSHIDAVEGFGIQLLRSVAAAEETLGSLAAL